MHLVDEGGLALDVGRDLLVRDAAGGVEGVFGGGVGVCVQEAGVVAQGGLEGVVAWNYFHGYAADCGAAGGGGGDGAEELEGGGFVGGFWRDEVGQEVGLEEGIEGGPSYGWGGEGVGEGLEVDGFVL